MDEKNGELPYRRLIEKQRGEKNRGRLTTNAVSRDDPCESNDPRLQTTASSVGQLLMHVM